MPLFRKGIKGFMLAKSVLHISHVNHLTKEKVIFSFSYMEGVIFLWLVISCKGFPGGSDSKEFTCNAGDSGLIPGLGRSPEEGNGNPLLYSCLESTMDRGTRWAAVHGLQRVGHDWSDRALTHMYIFIFLSIMVYYRVLNIFPCAAQ